MTARAVVIVPRRDADHGGDAWRDTLWDFCRERWHDLHPTYPVIEGHHNDGPFNRAAAINRAVAVAGDDWDVLLIIDADVLPDPKAVARVVEKAHATGRMCVSHTRRVMMSRRMTERVLTGYDGSWESPTQKVWTDSCSCCIAVSRVLWEAVGGFDEGFVGWGFEDSAFGACAKAATGPIHYEESTLYHLWHPTSNDALPSSPLRKRNEKRLREVEMRLAKGQLRAPAVVRADGDTTIPRILHRTVPASTTEEVEQWWDRFAELHPDWDLRTYREPIDPAMFPVTSPMWATCENGAQKAGLIRLEALVTWGGVYVDSDVEPFRSFEPLLGVEAFCGWEDENTIPDAVLGARPGHSAFEAALSMALERVANREGAWRSGPGVTTELLPGRNDVLVLPPGALYPYHYLALTDRAKVGVDMTPWAFVAHHWAHSWGSEAERAALRRKQKR